MSKQRLFLDFDSTIVDSIKSFCTVYNALYENQQGFTYADHTKVKQWNLEDQCALQNNPESIFSSSLFFRNLEFFPNAKSIIEKLCEKYEVYIVTIGNPNNLSMKSKWLKENLPWINNYILLYNGNATMNKSIVNWKKDDLFIDDVKANLDSARNKFSNRFIFGEDKEWNTGSNYKRLLSWNDINRELIQNFKPLNKFRLKSNSETYELLSTSQLSEPRYLI